MDDDTREWLAKACDTLSRENFAIEGAMKTLAEFLRSDDCPRSGDVLFRRREYRNRHALNHIAASTSRSPTMADELTPERLAEIERRYREDSTVFNLLTAYKALRAAATASHERAERLEQRLAARTPKWTTEKPTKPGWYWAKTEDDNYEPEVVLRDTNGMLWLSGEYESLIYTQFTHFAGPLPEPEDT